MLTEFEYTLLTGQHDPALSFPSWGDLPDSKGRPRLRPYQKKGALWLAERTTFRRGRLLADPPGFGKGRQIAAAMRLWAESGRCKVPVGLVICPAIARGDLKREIKEIWPEAEVHVLGENEKITAQERCERVRAIYERGSNTMLNESGSDLVPPFSFIITSYEMAVQLVDAVPQKLGPVCADEAHYLKKTNTIRSRVLRPFIAKAEIVFLTTGTPVHNRAIDVWNLMDLCAFGKFGNSPWSFQSYYNVEVARGGFGQKLGKLVDKQGLAARLDGYMLARDESEAYGQLPERIWKLIEVPSSCKKELRPPRNERELYKGLRDSAPYKTKTVVDLAVELDEPIVIYAWQKPFAATIASKLEAQGVSTTLATGDVVAEKRFKMIDAWKNGSTTALVCTMDAVKESATLTRASAMIFAELHEIPSVMAQNAGRIDPARQPEDQRRPVRYYVVVVEGTTDAIIGERNVEKIEEALALSQKTKAYAGLRGALVSNKPAEESVEDVLADVVTRINARASRLEGLL